MNSHSTGAERADSSVSPHAGLDPATVEQAILSLAAACGPGKTIAPMDVALAVLPGEQWQRALPQVRRSAIALAARGALMIYRKGKAIDPAELRGVYRLGLPRND